MSFNQILEISIILFLATYFLKGSFEFFNFLKALKFIYTGENIEKVKDEDDLPFIYVLLPVLREQKVIEGTIEKFLKINYPSSKYKIVVITTEKEICEKQKNKGKLKLMASKLSNKCTVDNFIESYLGILPENKLREVHNHLHGKQFERVFNELEKEYDNHPTTIDLINELRGKNQNANLEIIHYPYTKGVMAHQLNFAGEYLLRDQQNEERYICIYNADSEIDPDSFLEVSDIIKKNKDKDFVIQQSALFLKNFKRINQGLVKFFIYAGGLFQSYWTFSVEIPRIIKQNLTITKKKVKLAHCVGHGLYIKLKLFKEMGMLPLETMNEDLAFGFKLSANRIPIYPLRSLEIGDTPETFNSLINQKKVWFYSYIEYYKARIMSLRKINEKELVNNLFIQGSIYGFMWLLNSYLIILPLLYGFIYKDFIYLCIVFIFLLLFNFIPYYLLIRRVNNSGILNNSDITFSLKEEIFLSFFSVLIFFTDSLGPTISLFERLKSILTGKEIYKKKTER